MTGKNPEMEEIWALVTQEGRENLTAVEDILIRLEKDPHNHEDIAGLFRALHSFKGAVRMMGFSTTESLAHHAEDLVSLVRDEGIAIDEEMIDLLLVVTDRMSSILEYILSNHADVEPSEVALLSEKLLEMVKLKMASKEGPTIPLPETTSIQTAVNNKETKEPQKAKKKEKKTVPPQKLDRVSNEMDKPAIIIADKPSLEVESASFGEGQGAASSPEAIIFDPVSLANNPEYVKMFLEVAQPEMNRLYNGLKELRANLTSDITSDHLNAVREPADTLQIASEQMGYERLCLLLGEMMNAADPSQIPFTETKLQRLNDLEKCLSDEFRSIQGQSSVPVETESVNFSNLFNHWYSCRLKTDLDQLDQVIEKLSQRGHHLALVNAHQQALLAEDLGGVLGQIYHSCVFYHLDQAAHLTLALEDLSTRVRLEEVPVNDSLISLLQMALSQLRETFDADNQDSMASTINLDVMISLTQQLINATSKSPILQVARSMVESLDISPRFKDVLTNENMAEISQALRAGLYFYTVTANVDEDERLGEAFQKWVYSDSITPITHITTHDQNRAEVIFLISSSQDIQLLRKSLQQIDTQTTSPRITECALRPDVDPNHVPVNLNMDTLTQRVDTGIKPEGSISAETITELTEMVGNLMAEQSTLQRVTSRLMEVDATEGFLRLLRSTLDGTQLGNKTLENLRQDMESFWTPWEMDISTLAQTEVKLNAALIQLQEKTRSLGLCPASDLLDPLPKMAQSMALRLGKQINLDCLGADSELDQRTLSVLSETVKSMVTYCITESIELPEERQKTGKPIIGKISIQVTRTENHTQVMIEDDGRGLDRNKILAHGRKLGWTTSEENNDAEMLQWLFNPEFYTQSDMGVNLADLTNKLASYHAKVDLAQQKGRGLRFSISLPLDMVVLDGMVVRVGDVRYIVPVYAIQRILQPQAEQLINATADDVGCLLSLEGKTYPVRSFQTQASRQLEKRPDHPQLLVIIEKEPQAVALEVDELIGRQSVLVRPLSGHLVNVRNAMGCALLGEGEVGMVLNLEAL